MATPRRRRKSVAEIEALANKPTKAKRALPRRRAALVGSGARTYPQAKSPAPKLKRKPAKAAAKQARPAVKRALRAPAPTAGPRLVESLMAKKSMEQAAQTELKAMKKRLFDRITSRSGSTDRRWEPEKRGVPPRGVPPRGRTRMLDRPRPTEVSPPPDLGVFGRTVPKRGVPRRRR